MFQRFTDRARRAVVSAQSEARALNHNYIGTEHLLLGLLSVADGIAARALGDLDVTPEAVRKRIVELVGRGKSGPVGRRLPFTPRAKKTLELALSETLRLGHGYVGTEHVLLGLLREAEGVAAKILAELTEGPVAVETTVLEFLRGAMAAGAEDQRTVDGAAVDAAPPYPGPLCPECKESLAENAVYRILPVGEADGGGTASVLFVYCQTCGTTLDSLVAPDEPA